MNLLADVMGTAFSGAALTRRALRPARADVVDLVDLGSIAQGETATTTVWVHNIGPRPEWHIPVTAMLVGGTPTSPPRVTIIRPVVHQLDSDASAAVDIVVTADASTPCGHYVWVVRIDGVSDVVRILVSVGPARPGALPARLRMYGAIVEEAARRYTPRDEPARDLYDVVRDYPTRDAKHLRPAMLLATCEAFGGDVEDALPVAVALELMHNAFLVHDDIEDASELRRGLPTLHERHGMPLALNAGDALALFAGIAFHDGARRLGPLTAKLVVDEFHGAVRRTIEGQAIELGWYRDRRLDVRPADYTAMVLLKTCAYTTVYPLRVGALIAGRDIVDLDALTRFAAPLGLAFQVRDDLLSLDPTDGAGKDCLGDLFEAKRSLAMIHLLGAADPHERSVLHRFLLGPRIDRSEHAAAAILDMMYRHESLLFANAVARLMTDEARGMFPAAMTAAVLSAPTDLLHDLIEYALTRTV